MKELEYSDLVAYIHNRIEELDDETEIDLVKFVLDCEEEFLSENGYDSYEIYELYEGEEE